MLPVHFVPEQVTMSGNKVNYSVMLLKIISLNSRILDTMCFRPEIIEAPTSTDGLLTFSKKKKKSIVRLITGPTC